MNTVFEASYTQLKEAESEIERLRSLNAELVAALEYYASGIVGRGDIARAALAKVKEFKEEEK